MSQILSAGATAGMNAAGTSATAGYKGEYPQAVSAAMPQATSPVQEKLSLLCLELTRAFNQVQVLRERLGGVLAEGPQDKISSGETPVQYECAMEHQLQSMISVAQGIESEVTRTINELRV